MRTTSPAEQSRRSQACLRQTVRELRGSIDAGRPMSLPNALRLCRRRLAMACVPDSPSERSLRRLHDAYFKCQPFIHRAKTDRALSRLMQSR